MRDTNDTMSPFQAVFERLREILKRNSGRFTVDRDTPVHYSLEAPVGPAALRAWGGKMRKRTIPVAWVRVSKAYVSYHLMGVHGNPKLLASLSKELQRRMQGKSCFNFKAVDEVVFHELERLTVHSLNGMKNAGYISE